MELHTADLRRITADIWCATLGLSLTAEEGTADPSGAHVTGRVEITGEWTGAVIVQCTPSLARRASGQMFGASVDDVSEDDVRDTVGELANITGGNVKSLLGTGHCQLSLPEVSTLDEGAPTGGDVVDRVASRCDGELLVVTVLRRASTAHGEAATRVGETT